ncbi:hypothetical protein ACTPOK_36845 [Streptomyces inhibens]|uniref:hypothetical protein n=1 Tax=Streptomyces inhibens TaxID=2293571 RepID=UPI00402AB0A6
MAGTGEQAAYRAADLGPSPVEFPPEEGIGELRPVVAGQGLVAAPAGEVDDLTGELARCLGLAPTCTRSRPPGWRYQ